MQPKVHDYSEIQCMGLCTSKGLRSVCLQLHSCMKISKCQVPSLIQGTKKKVHGFKASFGALPLKRRVFHWSISRVYSSQFSRSLWQIRSELIRTISSMSKDNQSNSEEEYDDQANEYNQLEDLFVFSPLFGFPDLGMSNLNRGLTSSVRARSANVAGGSALRPNSDPNLTLNPSSPKGMRANPEMEYLRRCLEFLSARMGRLEEAVFGMMELQDHSPQERHRHHSFPSSPLNEPPKVFLSNFCWQLIWCKRCGSWMRCAKPSLPSSPIRPMWT